MSIHDAGVARTGAMRILAILIATGVVLNVAGVVRYPGGPLEAIGSRSGPLWLRLGTGPVPSPT